MNTLILTPEELLIGAEHSFDVTVPAHVLHPGRTEMEPSDSAFTVQIRPLTIGTFQLIMKAAKQDASLIPLLMIKESLVQPVLSLEQIKRLHLGLVNYLIDQIRQISGLAEKKPISTL